MLFLQLVFNKGKLQLSTDDTVTAVCITVPSPYITFTSLDFACLNSHSDDMAVLGLSNLVLASRFYSAVKNDLFAGEWTGSINRNP